VEPQLVQDFVVPGQVLFEYRDYAFLGDESREAAEAAWCANDQGLFWEMHDAIFQNQVGENDGAFVRDRLDRIAETVPGLDLDQWGSCMDDDTYEDQVEDDTQAAAQTGVQGTPSFLVNGELLFGASYEELSETIQRALSSQ
jgi:protein-disulfide isomerase